MSSEDQHRSVALVTLGCTRNEVDSEELAGRLAAGGWTLVDDVAGADVAVVNTCGFIEQAKKDSIDVILRPPGQGVSRAGSRRGQLQAQRCGANFEALPGADAVLGRLLRRRIARRAPSSPETAPPHRHPATGATCCR